MKENFNSNDIPLVKANLEKVDDDKLVVFQSIDFKSPTVAIMLHYSLDF